MTARVDTKHEVALLEYFISLVKSDPVKVQEFSRLVIALKEEVGRRAVERAVAITVERCAKIAEPALGGNPIVYDAIRSLSPSATKVRG